MNRMIVRRTLIEILRIRKVIKRMRLSVSMKKGRKSITLVICPAALVVSCPQGSGD